MEITKVSLDHQYYLPWGKTTGARRAIAKGKAKKQKMTVHIHKQDEACNNQCEKINW